MSARYMYTFILLAALALPVAAQNTGSITGQITDESGAVIPAANVSVLKAGAMVRSVQTNETGVFSAPNIPTGAYMVQVTHVGFAQISTRVVVNAGQKATLNTQLKLQATQQEVTVQADPVGTVSVDASQNASALVLRQAEIDALPDDPDDLATDLQALAGPAAGPNGGQIYIDGFTGGRLPPKESIREIRINQNPFSSEFDKLGFGRIEILTKPGSDKYHGQFFFNDSDGVFNARNPLITTTPDFSSRQFGGNVSGPIGKRASFFLDFEQRDIQDAAIIVAQQFDSSSNLFQFTQAVSNPQKRIEFSPRVDYQLNTNNTLVVKYNFERNTVDNSGIGQLTLASRATNNLGYEHSLQITETAVINAKMINETRFRAFRSTENDTALQTGLAINVNGLFNGGADSTPYTIANSTNFEVQNYTTITQGRQNIKFGVRVRTYSPVNESPANFLGTYTFASAQAYEMGIPAQYSVAVGNPRVSLNQIDTGFFFQDDWRLRPNLTVNLGLRYEIQNQIGDHADFAPRLGFAWSPDSKGNKQGKTVIRGGSGFFYDRFADDYSLNGLRYNGVTQQQYVLSATPTFQIPYPTPPTLAALQASGTSQTIQQVDQSLRAPYVIQTAIGVERALPRNTTLAVTYTNTRGLHQLRTRNINAPDDALGGVRPYGDAAGNIYNYESDGVFNQNQMIVNVNTRLTPAISLFSFYVLNYAKSNTDGIGTFPVNQYDFSNEYGRSSFDQRNRAFLGGSVTTRYGIRLSPFIVFNSGRPFNITDGGDPNGDSVFTDRPSLTTLPCDGIYVFCTSYGHLNIQPKPGETIIPRNFGDGPNYFSINIRLSKTFGFGERTSPAGGNRGGGGGGAGPFGMRGGPGGGRGGPGGMGDASTGKKIQLDLHRASTQLAQQRELWKSHQRRFVAYLRTTGPACEFWPGRLRSQQPAPRVRYPFRLLTAQVGVEQSNQSDHYGERDAVPQRESKQPGIFARLHFGGSRGYRHAGQADHFSHHSAA